ncbi:MAG: ABC transporter permease [Ferrimicrobium sp.]
MRRWGDSDGVRRSTWLIASRELRERGRAKSFWVATVILILAVAAGTVIPTLLGRHQGVDQVGVVLSTPTMRTQVYGAIKEAARISGVDVVVVNEPSLGAARAGLNAKHLALVVVGEREVLTQVALGPGSTGSTATLAGAVSTLVGQARVLRELPPRLAAAAGDGFAIPIVGLSPAPRAAPARFTGLAVAVLIYSLILFYGMRIAVGVGEEKTSRVIEVLLAAVRPTKLLIGKVIGMGVLALMQVAVMVATVAVAGAIVHSSVLHAASMSVVLVGSGWFLVGYAFYCTAFAAAGSLINRQMDSYNATLPLQIPLVVAYVLSFTVVLGSPSSLDQVLAYIPATAPVMMPVLFASGHVSVAGVVISLIIGVIATVLMGRVAAGIYSRAILRTGSRVRIREVWSARGQGSGESLEAGASP